MEEKKQTLKEVELRSEEVQEVMERVPSWILRCGITVLFGIVLALLAGSYWFRYPDVITAEVTISTEEPPAYVLARTSGRMAQLYVKNEQQVKKSQNLGVIENPARVSDVFALQSRMAAWKKANYALGRGKELFALSRDASWNLGDMQAVYATFWSVLLDAVRIKEFGYYSQKMHSGQEMLAFQEKYYQQARGQYHLVEKEQALARASYLRDSTLYRLNAMIITEFEESGSRYLQSLQSKESARMSLTQTAMQIEQAKASLLDLEKQAVDEEQTQVVKVKNATEQLLAELASWEQRYVLKSPVAGKVTFFGVWSSNQNVEAGETVFVVAPREESLPVGKALLPLQGSGKVKVGQRVNVRLNNYPDQEFGYIKGAVKSVSPVPTAEGMYAVDISFPNGLKTNYDKKLPLTREMKGSADIVTDDLRLLERLVMPLKKMLMEQKN